MKQTRMRDTSLFFEKQTSYPLFNLLYLHRDLIISFEELCGYLGLDISNYKSYFEFKSDILDPAYSEINTKTGLSYDYQGFNDGSEIRFSHIVMRPLN